jgi:hypothetical protein
MTLVLSNQLIFPTMSVLQHVPVIKDKLNGNVLYNMQDLHYAMFKNKRRRDVDTKKIRVLDNKTVLHRNKYRKLHSKDIFNSIKETTNYLLEKNNLAEFKITEQNQYAVIIKFCQTNSFDCENTKQTTASMFRKDNYNQIPLKCVSIVYYVRKDMGILGGNFLYQTNNTMDKCWRTKINEGQVLIYDGELKHAQENAYGIGCFDIISVFIPTSYEDCNLCYPCISIK